MQERGRERERDREWKELGELTFTNRLHTKLNKSSTDKVATAGFICHSGVMCKERSADKP